MPQHPKTAEELFDEIAETYEDTLKGNEALYRALSGLKSHHGPMSTVLDVGCGTGGPATYLIQQGYQVTGIDFSQKMVDHCSKHIPGSFLKVSMTRYTPSERFNADSIVATPRRNFHLETIDPEEYRGGEAVQGVTSDHVEGYTAPFMGTTVTITSLMTKGLLEIMQQSGLVIRSVEKHSFMPTTGDQEEHVYITAQRSIQEPPNGEEANERGGLAG